MNCDKEKGKRIFETEQEAIDFVQAHLATNGKQYAYLCEYGSHYHLSSSPNGSHGTTTDYEQFEVSSRTRRPYERSRELTDDEKRRVREEYASDHNIGAGRRITVCSLAQKYKTSPQRIYKIVHEASPILPVTIATLADKKARLEAELKRITQEEERLREEARLKIVDLDDRKLRLEKDSKVLILFPDDLLTLHTALEERLLRTMA